MSLGLTDLHARIGLTSTLWRASSFKEKSNFHRYAKDQTGRTKRHRLPANLRGEACRAFASPADSAVSRCSDLIRSFRHWMSCLHNTEAARFWQQRLDPEITPFQVLQITSFTGAGIGGLTYQILWEYFWLHHNGTMPPCGYACKTSPCKVSPLINIYSAQVLDKRNSLLRFVQEVQAQDVLEDFQQIAPPAVSIAHLDLMEISAAFVRSLQWGRQYHAEAMELDFPKITFIWTTKIQTASARSFLSWIHQSLCPSLRSCVPLIPGGGCNEDNGNKFAGNAAAFILSHTDICICRGHGSNDVQHHDDRLHVPEWAISHGARPHEKCRR